MAFRRPTLFLLLLCFLALGAHAQDTSLHIVSQAGDRVSRGKTLDFLPPDATIAASYNRGTLAFSAVLSSAPDPLDRYWGVTIDLPWGGLPNPGVYTVASNYPAGNTRVDISAYYGYWSFDGTVEIKRAVFDEAGLASLWLVLDLKERSSTGAFHAEAKFHADYDGPSVNQAPTIAIAVSGQSALEQPLAVTAYLTDDGLPSGSGLTQKWEVIDGGAPYAEFADPTARSTTVTFHEPGIYTLRLTVNDGERQQSQETGLQINVPVGRNSFHLAGPRTFLADFHGDLLLQDAPINLSRFFNYEVDFTVYGPSLSSWSVDIGNPGNLLPIGKHDRNANPETDDWAWVSLHDWSSHGANSEKLEVRAGTRPKEATRAEAVWITFPIYGAIYEPIALGELRYNIPAELVVGAPPIVDAGLDRQFTRGSLRRLHGAAMGVAGASDLPVTTAWSKVSGPGKTTFAEPAAVDTDVSFSAPGVYVLRLTATQGTATASDDLTVTNLDVESSVVWRNYAYAPTTTAEYRTAADHAFGGSMPIKSHLELTCRPFQSSSTADDLYLNLYAPAGEELKVGTYFTKAGDWDGARMALNSDEYGYAQPADGEFTISELTFDEKGQPTSARVSFTQYPDLAPGALTRHPVHGEFRWMATAVDPPNVGPRVFVGAPQHVTGLKQGSSTFVDARILDDLRPYDSGITTKWEMVSGPAQVEFGSPGASTSVWLPKPGVYVLRCTIDDGEFSDTDTLTIVRDFESQHYQGLISAKGGYIGVFNAHVLPSGHFTAVLIVGTSRVPLSGKFIDGGWSQSGYLRGGDSFSFDLKHGPGGDSVVGTARFGSTSFDLAAVQTDGAYLQTLGRNSPASGAYTWFSNRPPEDGAPKGYSYGLATVTNTGGCRLAGRLADGRPLSSGGTLGIDGTFTLCSNFADKELLAGPLFFGRGDDERRMMGGSLQWSRRKSENAGRFAAGFATLLQVGGASYAPPGEHANALTSAKGGVQVDLKAEALDSMPDPVRERFVLRPGGATSSVPGDGFTFQVDPKTGLFRGHLTDEFKRSRAFGGVLVQKQEIGAGSFLTDDAAGTIELSVTPE